MIGVGGIGCDWKGPKPHLYMEDTVWFCVSSRDRKGVMEASVGIGHSANEAYKSYRRRNVDRFACLRLWQLKRNRAIARCKLEEY